MPFIKPQFKKWLSICHSNPWCLLKCYDHNVTCLTCKHGLDTSNPQIMVYVTYRCIHVEPICKDYFLYPFGGSSPQRLVVKEKMSLKVFILTTRTQVSA